MTEPLMPEPATPQFLNVPTLLERSLPRPPMVRPLQLGGMFILIVIVSTLISSRGGEMESLVSAISMLCMFLLVSGLGLFSWFAVRKARSEQSQIEAIEELLR